MSSHADIVRSLHERLDEHLQGLRRRREGPLFFMEHALAEDEQKDLFSAIHNLISTQPLTERLWERYPLPLLVAASETGYQYRGAGTDFWPKLDAALGTSLSIADRAQVRRLFEGAAKAYHGATPQPSPWSSAFHLIAWPITHALFPVEFHRPLAAALTRLTDSISVLADSELHKAVRRAVGPTTARLDAWLASADSVALVVRALLNDPASTLDKQTAQRLRDDLSNDDSAHFDITAARAKQAQQHLYAAPKMSKGPSAPRRRGKVKALLRFNDVRGRLLLRELGEDRFSLDCAFAGLVGSGLASLRTALRRQRVNAKLWGVSAPIPLEQLLSGVPFPLRLSSVPSEEAPLLADLDIAQIPEEHHALITGLRVDIGPQLLFVRSADGDRGWQVVGRDVEASRRCWLLVAKGAEAAEELPKVAQVGPYVCLDVNLSSPTDTELLSTLGYRVWHSISARLIGPPSLDWGGEVPRFTCNSPPLLQATRLHPAGTRARWQGEEVALCQGEILRLSAPLGEHTLTLYSADGARDYKVLIEEEPPAPPAACAIELIAAERSVQALLAGDVALRVDGIAPIAGLFVSVELSFGLSRRRVTASLDPLPHIIRGSDPLWNCLVDDSLRRYAGGVTLRVCVGGGLANEAWEFERRVSPCWWERSGDRFALLSELGERRYGYVCTDRPIAEPAQERLAQVQDVTMLTPINIDGGPFDDEDLSSCLCVAPSSAINLRAPTPTLPRLLRAVQGRLNAVGLEGLIAGYLRWANAESLSWAVELRRRQLVRFLDLSVCRLSCGDEWAKREEAIREGDHWAQLTYTCQEKMTGWDPNAKLSVGEHRDVVSLGVMGVQRALPDLWAVAPFDLSDDDCEALDLAFLSGYQALAKRLRELGDVERASFLEDCDPPGTDTDTWLALLNQARAQAERYSLAELILPSRDLSALNTALLGLDYARMTISDLTDELIAWSQREKEVLTVQPPTREVIEALLALWIAPSQAPRSCWRDALNALITDRALARVVRYMSLRSRGINQGRVA